VNIGEYERMFSVENRHWWYRGLRSLVWQTWESLPGRPEGPLLDIGCGTGGTLEGATRPAVGIDMSGEALRFCRSRGQRALARADAAALPFAESSFAGAVMLDVLYHQAVTNPGRVLREARRVLKPGGRLIVNVPAYEWLRSSHDHAIHTARRFTRPQLHALFDSNGLAVERISYWNTFLFPAAAAVRLLRKSAAREESDLANYHHGLGAQVAGGVLDFERALMRRMALPFGLSVFAVGRRIA